MSIIHLAFVPEMKYPWDKRQKANKLLIKQTSQIKRLGMKREYFDDSTKSFYHDNQNISCTI